MLFASAEPGARLLIATLAALAGWYRHSTHGHPGGGRDPTVGAFTALKCVKAVYTPTEAFFRPGITTLSLVADRALYLVLMMAARGRSDLLWNVLRVGGVTAVPVLFLPAQPPCDGHLGGAGQPPAHDQADGMRIVPATVRRSNRWLLIALVGGPRR